MRADIGFILNVNPDLKTATRGLCCVAVFGRRRTRAEVRRCLLWSDLGSTVSHKSRVRMADEEDDAGYDEEAEDGGGLEAGGHGKRKRLFSKELRCMMYGFGDDQNPYTESVDILEDLVIEFVTEMTHKAMSIGRQGRVQVEDIVFLIRKDPRKFARVKDLLTMNEELKRARKAFDEANYGS
ncbi:unnamed protein product [Arctogadus glacialis]